MNNNNIYCPVYRKEYFEGFSIGLDPYKKIKTKDTEAFISGFTSGRLEYETLNGLVLQGIPQRIISIKILEDFLLAGMLGLSIDADNYSSHQLNIIVKWYQSGIEKYEPQQSTYLFEILEENGIKIN